MPKSAIILFALFGAALACAAVMVAFQSTDSEPDVFLADLLFVVPTILCLAGFSFFATWRAMRRGAVRFRWAILGYAGVILLAYLGFQITTRYLVPSDIRYEFTYPGNTGTYHMVQFYFRENGRWLEGPSVQGWPMKVSFPDLNGDGHRDIRVIERQDPGGGAVEFVYLPRNDGHIFWRAVRNDTRLSAAYLAADYFSNYP